MSQDLTPWQELLGIKQLTVGYLRNLKKVMANAVQSRNVRVAQVYMVEE